MTISIAEISSSLVREYLSRKGLKKTIVCMDEEHPRTEASVNNRSQLRQMLNLEALYRKSKVENSQFKTLLEIIVKHLIDGTTNELDARSLHFNTDDGMALRSQVEVPKTSHTTLLFPEKTQSFAHHKSSLTAHDQNGQGTDVDLKIPVTESKKRNKASRPRRGMMTGPVASTPEESIKKRQIRKAEYNQPLPHNEREKDDEDCLLQTVQSSLYKDHYEFAQGSSAEQLTSQMEKRVQSSLNVSNVNVSEMVLDDIDDEEMQSLPRMFFNKTITRQSWTGCPMDQQTATELKVVLLGSSLNCFSVEWRNQGFTFSEIHDLRYGIVQTKGGPCGVLASVQGFVMKKMLFEDSDGSNCFNKLRPSNSTRRKCLVLAIAEILWRAGEEKQVIVAMNSGSKHFIPAGKYKSDGVLESILLFTLDNQKALEQFLDQHIEQFESTVMGCLLLVVSAVLSRSIDKLREDMDVPTTTLIGAHGYCTQELVNLLLCGQAVSNVFDNDMELDSGNSNLMLLKGIKYNSDIGLLSLFEHYNICKVGNFLKTPRFPIWVVCSESHFSVLFGLQRELLTSHLKEFDLYYYDGLSNQQEEIRLSVCVDRSAPCSDEASELIPPLELCIRTRWKDAAVNWNDTEPIL
ncbi:unnamed protein product [Knipowitschia caucasica]|uniref:Ubiquitin carboxyl-terminal hydrolase MINDY n=1 Tax=Knipowitschia caucasica TaxID=637954 RepID=A0AAV2KU96_KNICA